MTVATGLLIRSRPGPYRRAVAREATSVEIADIRTKPLGEGIVRTSAGTGMPSRFLAIITLDRPALTVRMEVRCAINNAPEIRKLEIEPRIGAITAGSVRALTLDYLLRQAAASAQIRIEPRTDIGPDAFQVAGDRPGQYRIGEAKQTTYQQRADDLAAQAAAIYQSALAEGSAAPAEAVAAALYKSRSQAARYIRRARELGLLPPLGQGGTDAS